MFLDRADNFVDSTPLVLILSAALDHTEAFQDVYDVVDSSAFDAELPRALVQVEQTSLWSAVQEEEAPAQLAKTLLFAVVGDAFNTVVNVTVDL